MLRLQCTTYQYLGFEMLTLDICNFPFSGVLAAGSISEGIWLRKPYECEVGVASNYYVCEISNWKRDTYQHQSK